MRIGIDIDNVISIHRVPSENDEIERFMHRRCSVLHPTVMYKKSTVLKAGNYEHCPLMEDDMLWIRMLLVGAKCANIDDYLVYARTGYAMIERRGGWKYFKKYKQGRKMILDTGYINKWDYCKTIGVQFVVALVPKEVRLFIFTKLLRKG